MNATDARRTPRALISGASFAGLTAAFWMRELGYEVTVVETAPSVKSGGTPVDIRDETVAVVERMGLLDAIRAKSLAPRPTEFANVDGGIVGRIEPEPQPQPGAAAHPVDGSEIHRDDLLAILLSAVEGDVDVRFDTAISTMTDLPDGIRATFRDGSEGEFDIVLGCDGNHSSVRRMRFGPEADYSRFLHNYFSVTVVEGPLLPQQTTRILNTPGRTLMLNSYDSTTDIALGFHADDEIPYDYRDVEEQKRIVRERFADAGAPFAEFVDRATSADGFYFDKLSQTRMPAWSSDRVVLVGDAAYCASPAAGMGGSLAILGATALFDAFRTVGGDFATAFAEYERAFRPVVEQIQADVVDFGLATYFPETQEAIDARDAFFGGH